MAEEITKYTVSVSFDSALKKLGNFEKKMTNLNKKQESSLKKQISLQRQLNSLSAITRGRGGLTGGGARRAAIPSQKATIKASKTAFADMLRKEDAAIKADSKARQKLAKSRFKGQIQGLGPTGTAGKASQTAFADMLRQEEKAEQISKRRAANLERAVKAVKRTALWQDKVTTKAEKEAKARLVSSIRAAKTADEVRNIVASERQRLREMKRQERSLRKQSFILQRMKSSSKQLAGNMVSAFAIGAVGVGIVRTGQQFEAVRNTMLAVSDTSEDAADNFKFVRNEAFRLGLGLSQSAKGFAKMIAAQGELSKQDIRKIFIGVSELGTVLGLTAEEAGRATNAITQMLSKGKISAEELRLQLGEVLPSAIQDMARAAQRAGKIDKALGLNEATAAMFKLQEQGKLISSEILPAFGQILSESASKGLAGALKSNRVAMNRFVFSMQEAADIIFKGGLATGLTEFFNTTAKSTVELKELWQGLGKVFGAVFRIIAAGVRLITPTLIALGSIVNGLADAYGEVGAAAILIFNPFMLGLIHNFGIGILRIMAPVLAIAAGFREAAFWAEELMNLFVTRDKVGILFDPRKQADEQNAATRAAQFGAQQFETGTLSGLLTSAVLLPAIIARKIGTDKLFGGGSAAANPFKGGATPSTQVNVELKLDSETVAKQVVKTSQFESGVIDQIAPLLE